MGVWITLGVLALLAILPLGVRICYDANGPLVKAILGPVKVTLYPRQKKEKKSPKKEKNKADSGNQQPAETSLPKPPQPPPAPKPEETATHFTARLGGDT